MILAEPENYIISIEDAKEQLETAKEVVELVERYLKTLDEKYKKSEEFHRGKVFQFFLRETK